jgi:hypothetical protein
MGLPDCGHDERYEMSWREVSKGGQLTHVWFCIACNYDLMTKKIAKEGPLPVKVEEEINQGGM